MKITLTVESDNAEAMEDPHFFAAEMLREAADKLSNGYTGEGFILDVNGNTVGSFELNV